MRWWRPAPWTACRRTWASTRSSRQSTTRPVPRRPSAPSSDTCRLLARDHAAPEPTLALSKAIQPCCGQARTLAWCSRPRNSTASLDGALNLDAENTAIVVDSTADFPDAPERFPNWRVVPLYVRFGDESFRDYVELAPEAFYERLRAGGQTPATSQPTPADFLAVYEELAGYERILSIHIAGRLSGTIESARTAAQLLGGERVRTIDSGSASAAIALLGLAVQRRLEEGTTDEEVGRLVERYRRDAGLLFTLETFEYLVRGGRVGRARAWAGELLHIKPILTIEDGEVIPVKRVRGNRKAFLEFASAFVADTSDGPQLRVGIAHADAPEKAEALRALVGRTRPAAVIELVTSLGPVVGAHAGPGTVGFFWFHDEESRGAS